MTTRPQSPGTFRSTGGVFQSNYGGGSGNANAGSNGFVAKIDPGTDTLVYSSYLGGSTADVGIGIAIDSANPPNAYVTGTTLSTDFPIANAFQSTLSGTSDAFVSEVNPTGTALTYSSYLGGTGGTRTSMPRTTVFTVAQLPSILLRGVRI